MRTKLFLCVQMLLWAASANLMAQKWDWARRVYSTDSDIQILDMDTDASGNIYFVSDCIKDPVLPSGITMGGAADDPSNGLQGYIAKVAPNGTFQWAKRVKGLHSIHQEIYVFPNGKIAVSGGGLQSDLVFNGVTYPVNTANHYVYFLLYDADGTELSAHVFKMDYRSAGDVSSDGVGDKLHFCTVSYDTIFYNNTYLAPPLGNKNFMFHFVINDSGQLEAAMQLGEDYGYSFNYNIVANSRGQVYLMYGDNNAANPGNGVNMPNPNGVARLVTIKFDADGKALWLYHTDTDIPSDTDDLLGGDCSIVLDDHDNCYLTDGFRDKMIVAGQTYTTVQTGMYMSFMLKLNDQGEVVWFLNFPKTEPGPNRDVYENALKYNGKGFLYAAGQTTGNIYFGDFFKDNKTFGNPIPTVVEMLQYLVKVDTAGVVNRVRFYDLNLNRLQYTLGMTTYDDKVYVNGTLLQGDMSFDNNPVLRNFVTGPNVYKYDGFLASYTDCNAQITKNGNQLTASSALSYQWYRNGAAISNETNQSFTPTLSGNYAVEVTFTGGCVSRSATLPLNLTVTGTTGESEAASLTLFPNPASSAITLSLVHPGDAETVNVEFYNQQGLLVMGMDYPNWADQAEYVVNIESLEPGLYHAKIRCGEKQSSATFIKQ